MSEVNAATALLRLRERLKMIQLRAMTAVRAAAGQGRQPSPKTVELLGRIIEVDTYADATMIAVAGLEEDAANEEAEAELVMLSEELDKIAGAVHERIAGPRPPEHRLDRSSS